MTMRVRTLSTTTAFLFLLFCNFAIAGIEAEQDIQVDSEFAVDCSKCHAGEPDKVFPPHELSPESSRGVEYVYELLQQHASSDVTAFEPETAFKGDALAGQNLAKNLCSTCHALEAGKLSPNEAAPNFNALTLTYPPEHLAEGFAEGIVVGTDAHIGMPQFALAPEQIDNLIAYLETVLPPFIEADDLGD